MERKGEGDQITLPRDSRSKQMKSMTRSKISASIKKVHATGRKMDGSKALYSKSSPVLSSLDGIGSQTQVIEAAKGKGELHVTKRGLSKLGVSEFGKRIGNVRDRLYNRYANRSEKLHRVHEKARAKGKVPLQNRLEDAAWRNLRSHKKASKKLDRLEHKFNNQRP